MFVQSGFTNKLAKHLQKSRLIYSGGQDRSRRKTRFPAYDGQTRLFTSSNRD
ncbi:MAG: hypothetical protein WBO93_11250 [Gammaproteobacteria bacterium]|jgi:hypothetical protein